jgi:hypothetical protein
MPQNITIHIKADAKSFERDIKGMSSAIVH